MLLQVRGWLVAGLLSISGLTAQAQVEPTPPPLTPAAEATAPALAPLQSPKQVPGKYQTYLLQRYSAEKDKEARAAIALFTRRHSGGTLWLLSGAAAIIFVTTQTGTRDTPGGGSRTLTVTPLGYGGLLALFGGIGIGKLARFSNEKLYQALLTYDQQGALPELVRGRLKASDIT